MVQTLGNDDELARQGPGRAQPRRRRDGDITLKKAEETIGKPIYWQMPNDAKAMTESRNDGVPLVQHAPRSKLQQSFAGLAKALCGKKEAARRPRRSRPAGLVLAAMRRVVSGQGQ